MVRVWVNSFRQLCSLKDFVRRYTLISANHTEMSFKGTNKFCDNLSCAVTAGKLSFCGSMRMWDLDASFVSPICNSEYVSIQRKSTV